MSDLDVPVIVAIVLGGLAGLLLLVGSIVCIVRACRPKNLPEQKVGLTPYGTIPPPNPDYWFPAKDANFDPNNPVTLLNSDVTPGEGVMVTTPGGVMTGGVVLNPSTLPRDTTPASIYPNLPSEGGTRVLLNQPDVGPVVSPIQAPLYGAGSGVVRTDPVPRVMLNNQQVAPQQHVPAPQQYMPAPVHTPIVPERALLLYGSTPAPMMTSSPLMAYSLPQQAAPQFSTPNATGFTVASSVDPRAPSVASGGQISAQANQQTRDGFTVYPQP